METKDFKFPALEGEHLVLTWDQAEFETVITCGDVEVWREHTGWEVYDRFVEMAAALREHYGDRLADLIPTQRSKWALYGDSSAAVFHVEAARRSLREPESD